MDLTYLLIVQSALAREQPGPKPRGGEDEPVGEQGGEGEGEDEGEDEDEDGEDEEPPSTEPDPKPPAPLSPA